MKRDKEFYINLGFVVFTYVLTLGFFKEYVFQSDSVFSTVLSSLIGLILGGGLIWLLKKKKLFVKVAVLCFYILIIAVTTYSINRITTSDLSISKASNLFIGNWLTKEDGLKLKLRVDDRFMKMKFYPDNEQLNFKYEVKKGKIDFFNDKDSESFYWKIIKLSNDSLVVFEKDQILRFRRIK